MKKILILITIILLVGVGLVVIKKKKEELNSLPTPKAKLVTVEIAKPKNIEVEQKRVFIGRYYSAMHPQISSKLSGFIKKVYVSEGDKVKRGDILIQIDDKELKESIKAQQASINALKFSIDSIKSTLFALKNDYLYAKEVYERNKALYEAEALPKEKLDLSKVMMDLKESKLESTKKSLKAKEEELKALKAGLKSKITQLRYTSIKSPLNATVGKIYLKDGDLAMPGKPILQLLGEKKRVEFEFPLSMSNNIKEGMSVYIQNKKAKISKILPNSQKALAVARIESNSLNLPENIDIKVEVVQKSAKGTAIPVKAILEKDDENYVFVYKNGRFHPKKIKILAKNESYAVISPDIKEPVAIGSNDKLSRLFFLKQVKAISYE